ncbi:MAG: nucleotidyltransferase [Bacillota bacterium]
MIITAVICEYNPFHNGHLYQLQMARKLTHADYIVAVMSGNFVQRGEPAIINKWARSEIALLGGADLIIELPLPFAISSAEYFASGAIKLLNSTRTINYVCFGSEIGSTEKLFEIAEIYISEDTDFKRVLHKNLESGLSFPTARANALPKNLREIASQPNNILGIEYIKALIRTNSKIRPITLKREGSDYNEILLPKGNIFASATSIRKNIYKSANFVTVESQAILEREFSSLRGPVYHEEIFQNLRYKIRNLDPKTIKEYPGVSEGLENKIFRAFATSNNLDEAIQQIISKRYPKTRIMRSLLCIYLDLNNSKMASFYASGPTYIRVLGFKKSSKPLLKQIKLRKLKRVEFTTRLKTLAESHKKSISNLAQVEMLSTDLYVLNYPKESTQKYSGQEFTTNPVILQ